MAETVASVVGPTTIDQLVKCIAVPIKRQFKYLCCFNSNIENLRDEAKKLDVARDGLTMQVDRAKDNVEIILPQVEDWLTNANNIREEKSSIEVEIPKVQSGCLSIKARFSVSKKATKAAECMKELREGCMFDSVSVPAPPTATEPGPSETSYNFESRKQIEEDIMTTLRSKNVNMIGICGMGGVGKTTMAKRIINRVIEEHLFDEVVLVVVSQNIDTSKIQQEIAEPLGLKLEDQTLGARADKLYKRLRDAKTKLLVLDDVWKSLKLQDLGIPCESDVKGCKILLTSRNRDALTAMNVQKICGLKILSEGEAWFLYREKVGTCVDDLRLRSIAKDVVKECKGLPIALATVGVALKDENNIYIWQDALQQLKRSNPEYIPDVIKEVYNPLELSYDFLPNELAKSLFLLCCLFPEDDNIPLEHLTYFAMGLRMFEGITNLEEARSRTYTLIKILKNRFLLLDGSDENHVKVHDVVRDVSIFIAKKEKYVNGNDCTYISSFVSGRAVKLGFSNLHLFFINTETDEEFQVSDSFVEGTIELSVLFMMYSALISLPQTTRLLRNLRTLILEGCYSLEAISIVGELVNLEILICRYCESIEELPLEIGRLTRLRLLELSNCWNLKTIAPGVISSLVGLEELKMVDSFMNWKAENTDGKERKNAGLSELEFLFNLTCLEIEVKDSTLATQHISLPPKIVKYDITIGDCDWEYVRFSMGCEKKMKLHLPRDITLGNWIHEFVRSAEYICLVGDASNYLNLGQGLDMRSLIFKKCPTTSLIEGRYGATIIFPLLETLRLEKLDNLEEICSTDGLISEVSSSDYSFKNLKELRLVELPALKHFYKSPYQNTDFAVVSLFSNLSSIEIKDCHSLRNLFSLSMAKDCLLQLERLEIVNCDMMEEVFLWNNQENEKNIGHESRHITIFPKLKSVKIFFLRNLATFCKGIESIEFPMLTEMNIQYCPNLKSLVSSSKGIGIGRDDDDDDDDDHSLHLLCKLKVSFGNLKELRISENAIFENAFCLQMPFQFFTGLEELFIKNCDNVRCLFSSSAAQNLVNLRILRIWSCSKMVKVIEDEDTEKDACGAAETTNSLFPKLEYLSLASLPKLKSFCEWRCHLQLPSLKDACGSAETTNSLFPKLEELNLQHLPKLMGFCEWRCALELPSLKKMWINKCPEMERFSLGSLTTPNLEEIEGDVDVDIKTTDDLNGALQRRLLRVKELEEEKK